MPPSVQPYILRSALAIQVINEEVAEHLDTTSLTLHRLQQGLIVQQGYLTMAKFHPGYNVITCLQDVNRLEHDHWVNPIRDLPHMHCHVPWWNPWQDTRYPMTNADHTGQCAVVHAVDMTDLGLPAQPDSHAILLYVYEGEELCSVLEGNGFCFPGSDQRDSFLHFQGDEILSIEEQYLGVYFPSFPHEDALIVMETIIVPDRELDIMGADPLAVMAWEESPWYCCHWDVPWISKWNECIDFMWRSAWHKKNDEYLTFIKGHVEDPLLKRIIKLEVDLEEADELILDLLPSLGSSGRSTPALFRRSVTASSGGGGPPLSNLSDLFRDPAMAEEAKPEVASPSPKHARSEDGPEGSIGRMGNPTSSDSSDSWAKRARHLAPASILRRSICM